MSWIRQRFPCIQWKWDWFMSRRPLNTSAGGAVSDQWLSWTYCMIVFSPDANLIKIRSSISSSFFIFFFLVATRSDKKKKDEERGADRGSDFNQTDQMPYTKTDLLNILHLNTTIYSSWTNTCYLILPVLSLLLFNNFIYIRHKE